MAGRNPEAIEATYELITNKIVKVTLNIGHKINKLVEVGPELVRPCTEK